jgi:hypothetical protein
VVKERNPDLSPDFSMTFNPISSPKKLEY